MTTPPTEQQIAQDAETVLTDMTNLQPLQAAVQTAEAALTAAQNAYTAGKNALIADLQTQVTDTLSAAISELVTNGIDPVATLQPIITALLQPPSPTPAPAS